MSFYISKLIEEQIKGLKSYFQLNNIKISKDFFDKLTINLNLELSKPFENQFLTPTQIMNELIKDELKINMKLTPHNLGKEFNELLMQWGIEKAQYLNEK